jgi:hypothetical protein
LELNGIIENFSTKETEQALHIMVTHMKNETVAQGWNLEECPMSIGRRSALICDRERLFL